MPNLKAEAMELDALAAELAARMTSDFIRIGKVMDAMTDDYQRWRLLEDPRTGLPYTSQEAWVTVRFRSQRATAFEARRIYRTLHNKVPDELLETAEPGSLKILERLPESAQKNPNNHTILATTSVGEFTSTMLHKYPDHLKDQPKPWTLKPTISQAAFYDRVLEKVQEAYRKQGEELSREEALEYSLRAVEEHLEEEEEVKTK